MVAAPVEARFLAPGQQHIIGILGGLGPAAGDAFKAKLTDVSYRRGAVRDQDCPVVRMIDGSPTPDRTAYLLDPKPENDPRPYLIHFAQELQNGNPGAGAIFVICNTAHAFHEDVQRELNVPWVHFMKITAERVREAFPEVKRVGVLATTGTLNTGLYHKALAAEGLETVAFNPNDKEVDGPLQAQVMDAIYSTDHGIKKTGSTVSEQSRQQLTAAADELVKRGAQLILLACTEIPLALNATEYTAVPLLDPMDVAAEVAHDIAFGKRQPSEFMIPPAK